MTYAIIRTGGKQFRAESGKTIRIPSLTGDAGSKVTFDDVILGSDGDKKHVGAPAIKGAHVTGEIVKHGRGEKIVDRKCTRLNSSHVASSYAVFCLKKKMKFGPP